MIGKAAGAGAGAVTADAAGVVLTGRSAGRGATTRGTIFGRGLGSAAGLGGGGKATGSGGATKSGAGAFVGAISGDGGSASDTGCATGSGSGNASCAGANTISTVASSGRSGGIARVIPQLSNPIAER